MSNRKLLVGGYPDSDAGDSSDDPGTTLPSVRHSSAASYAPPRISTATAGTVRGFQFPQHGLSYGSTQSGSRLASLNSSLDQPALNLGSKNNTSGNPDVGSQHDTEVSQTSRNPTQLCSALSLERQINDLASGLEEYVTSNNERHQKTDDKLTYLTTIVEKLVASHAAQTQDVTPSPPLLGTLPSTPAAIVFTNPPPTAELGLLVSKVCSEARLRVGKKKSGPEENGMRDHMRSQFFEMISVPSSKEIRAYFVDEYGKPDTLPSQFADPETGYIQPCPYWPGSLLEQLEWLPTYISRVRMTIPHDQSDLSKALRDLTDEHIVTYLHDGIFRTCQTVWRNMRKTPEQIAASRSHARRYQHKERKANVRSRYIKTIPSLQGPEWGYLTHTGYVSAEESDDEGGLIVKRLDYRPQWEINLYAAIGVAENARTRPNLNQPSPLRKFQIVPGLVPQLRRGSGAGKSFVQVPLCAFNKAWRAKNSDELKKSVHLVNMKIVNKPDINYFLAEHPISTPTPTEQMDEAVGQNFYPPETGAGADGCTQDHGGDDGNSRTPEGPIYDIGSHPQLEIPIDPALFEEANVHNAPQRTVAQEDRTVNHTASGVSLPGASLLLRAGSACDPITATPVAPTSPPTSYQSTPPSDMPPPPSPSLPLSSQIRTADEDLAPVAGPPPKRPRQSKNPSATPSTMPAPKKRGRP
ncbi:hypothetical protein RhiJN_23542 [Ceratobasidium sp. AG-Ba]|nr:hypothetical protein RhiJN_23542 [Ceratobasidium sp. AG-Ba]